MPAGLLFSSKPVGDAVVSVVEVLLPCCVDEVPVEVPEEVLADVLEVSLVGVKNGLKLVASVA